MRSYVHGASSVPLLGQTIFENFRNTARRGTPIIVFNPLKERALERFEAPQAPIEMAHLGSGIC